MAVLQPAQPGSQVHYGLDNYTLDANFADILSLTMIVRPLGEKSVNTGELFMYPDKWFIEIQQGRRKGTAGILHAGVPLAETATPGGGMRGRAG